MAPPFEAAREQWLAGEAYLAGVIDSLPDDALDEPSLLPDWTRRTLLAHVARNADAIGNLVAWARTGVETPMYASPEARAEGIALSATQPAALLRADVTSSVQRLRDDAAGLTDEQWHHEVQTAQGRTVPASEVVWMRAKEAWVHAVDLDAGGGFAGAPLEFLVALIDDVLGVWERRGDDADLALETDDGAHTWKIGTGGVSITLALADIAAVVTGRAAPPEGVTVPAWI